MSSLMFAGGIPWAMILLGGVFAPIILVGYFNYGFWLFRCYQEKSKILYIYFWVLSSLLPIYHLTNQPEISLTNVFNLWWIVTLLLSLVCMTLEIKMNSKETEPATSSN